MISGGKKNLYSSLTKKQFVFVYNVTDAKVECPKYQNHRLDYTIQQGHHEYEDSLRVHNAVIDHWRRIQLGIIFDNINTTRYSTKLQLGLDIPLGVRVINKRYIIRGIITPKLSNCSGMMPSPVPQNSQRCAINVE